MRKLSHVNKRGEARMVDVSAKKVTARKALARARIAMKPATLRLILGHRAKKGDVLGTARLAGIMAAKNTSSLIPLCHPLPLAAVKVDFRAEGADRIEVTAEAKATARTGVEMEALVAASVAALTIYDMCKAADRGMVIQEVCLVEKSGGKSGRYVRTP